MAGVRSSTEVRFGPDPRISIQARGAPMPHDEAGHTEAPDRMPNPPKKTLASKEASTHGHDGRDLGLGWFRSRRTPSADADPVSGAGCHPYSSTRPALTATSYVFHPVFAATRS